MAIPVTCDLCGATTPIPAEYAGGMAECPRFRLRLAVPIPETTDDFRWTPPATGLHPRSDTDWELPIVVDEGPRD
ncbi:MAG TPA: hypothetical protein VGH33_22290 [Isosphaeraceae bacterium]